VLESVEKLGPIELAYETYGELNAKRSNAILVLMLSPEMLMSRDKMGGGATS